jgi:hypothetical protein
MDETVYLIGYWMVFVASVGCVGAVIAHTFIPKELTRWRDGVIGATTAFGAVILVGLATCVASHLRWQ